ncbi:MAG: ABC transporter permease [Bacteroidales bacterium]|nr:ABC transporter permease [Bacteroidales bacterium]
MNLHITSIIIRREYLNRVKKKSFLLITFLAPVLFAALCMLPTLIMMNAREEAKKIAVVDASGIVMPLLQDSETTLFTDLSGADADSLKLAMKVLGYDAVLDISGIDEQEKTLSASIYSLKPLGMDMTQNINARVNDAVEAYRIESYKIADLESIMKDVKSDVRLRSYTIGEDGSETVSESGVYMLVSMLLGMAIYMFIALFSGMVMSSVIEEKASRVVEVLVSSVKATELMFGKIIGVALVAMTQFLLWIVLTVGIVGVAGGLMGQDILSSMSADPTAMMSSGDMAAGAAEALEAAASGDGPAVIVSTLRNMPIGTIALSFLLYFLFGYMLYASVFAAIGSGAENEGDTQQLQLPVTVPLLIGFFIAIYAFKAPDSAIVFWGSMIPFTSPIVMLARLPFGVPFWELALSVALLVATFALFAWASAKIYRVGILMFGKKTTWKDLWKWFRQN